MSESLPRVRVLFILVLALGLGAPQPGNAQGIEAREALDRQLLRGIYQVKAPAFRALMRGADYSAYPVFVGAPIAAWGGVWLLRDGDDRSDAYQLTLTQVMTYLGVVGLKHAIRRPRPYHDVPGIQARKALYQPQGRKRSTFAFPSGHAALSFAIVTSWSLSHPRWYVIGPGAAWATSVALSRVWLGLHYPSDVLGGAVLGIAIATGVHLLGDTLTPGFVENGATPMRPSVRLRFRL